MSRKPRTQPAEIGDVPEHWVVTSLDSFTSRITYGFTNPMPTTAEGPYMLTAKDIHGGRIDYGNARRTSWDAYHNRLTDKSRPRIGDVLLTKDGSIGRVGLCDRSDVCINQSVALLQPNESISPRFLKYLLEAPHYQRKMEGDADGTTIKHIYITRVDKMQVAVPPLREQKAIAAILGALDDKIELNRRMNATLEAMARALFQSWFVDFDPVRANMDGRRPATLDSATLFPESLEDSPLGPIPKGWKVCPLAELVTVVKGRSYRSEELAESKTALVTLKSFLRGGGYRIDGLKPFTGEYKPDQLVRAGELVVAFTDVTQAADVIGKPALVRNDNRFESLVASLDVGIVRPKSNHVSIPFLYCLFLTSDFQSHAYSHATGTTVLHLGSKAIPSFVSAVPPVDIAEKFAEQSAPIFRLIDENVAQSGTLAALRDTLLPKLLSGELSVKAAEELVA